MARKPAQTQVDDQAKDAAATASEDTTAAGTGADQAATDAGAAGDTDTGAVNGAASAADAPDHVQGTDAPGQTGGEVDPLLPAGQPAGEAGAGPAIPVPDGTPVEVVAAYEGSGRRIEIAAMSDLLAASLEGSALAAALAAKTPAWIVTCHREGGRRRAGRRWPQGDTPITEGDLTGYELAMLQGDPLFTVRPA